MTTFLGNTPDEALSSYVAEFIATPNKYQRRAMVELLMELALLSCLEGEKLTAHEVKMKARHDAAVAFDEGRPGSVSSAVQ